MNWKHELMIFSTAAALGAALLFPVGAAAEESQTKSASAGTIPQHVSICGKDVSGMTSDEAKRVVEDYLKKYGDVTFTLRAADKSVEASGEELALRAKNEDVVERALNYGQEGSLIARYKAGKDMKEGKKKDFLISLTADTAAVQAYLEKKHESISTDVVNNTVKREGSEFVYVEGKEGVSVQTAESALAVAEYISTKWDGKDADIDLITKVDKPKGSKEELSKIKDLLGGYNTSFASSNAGRAQNVSNGTGKLNGIVLYPGETLSVYEVCHPFEISNGYAVGGAYENGTLVDSIGGGICQVSTTLYNAVMRAELEIVTRAAHSMTVSYVEPSQDAAIAGTSKDFQFKNNLDAPIYIEGYTSNKRVYFNIFGQETRPAGRQVSFWSEITSQTDPVKQFVASADFPVGYVATTQDAHTGYTARLWKIVTENGVETSREVYNNSTYKVSNAIVTVGVASADPNAVTAINQALATQDEATIRGAAARWSSEGIAAAAIQAQQEEEARRAEEEMKKQQQANNDKKKENDGGNKKESSSQE